MTSVPRRFLAVLVASVLCVLVPQQCLPTHIARAQDAIDNTKTANPDVKDAVVVVAKGVGLDSDGALKNAFLQAVRQVVGTYVDSETLVKNDELVYDKVLTYSRGFVTKYKIIAEGRRDGLVRVTIQATVHRQKLVAKLTSTNITVRKFPGRNLFASTITRMQRESEETALFEKVLYPGVPENTISADVIGKPKVGRADGKKTLNYNVRLAVDQKQYKAFTAGIMPFLERVATRKGDMTLDGEVAPDGYRLSRESLTRTTTECVIDSNGIRTSTENGTTGIRHHGQVFFDVRQNAPNPRFGPFSNPQTGPDSDLVLKTVTLIVNTNQGSTVPGHTTWRWYQVPIDVVFPFSLKDSFSRRKIRHASWRTVALLQLANRADDVVGEGPFSKQFESLEPDLRKYLSGGVMDRDAPKGKFFTGRPQFWKHAGKGLVCNVVFLDGLGKQVFRHTFPTTALGSLSIPPGAWVISPYVLFSATRGNRVRWGYSTGITISREEPLKLNDLKSVAEIAVRVERNRSEYIVDRIQP